MVFPVHLQLAAVVAIVDCPDTVYVATIAETTCAAVDLAFSGDPI